MLKRDGSLENLFAPRSIAVAGVSLKDRESMGSVIYNRLKESHRDVYPINPKADDREGFYRSVKDVPVDLDLAIIAVPAVKALEVVEGCIDSGVRTVIMIPSGFSEAGRRGEERGEEIRRLVENSSTRVLGPNTIGVFRPSTGLDTLFADEDVINRPGRGGIGMISQSGFLSLPFFEQLYSHGYGISIFAGIGNRVDIDENELLSYYRDDDETEVITVYLENFADGREFYRRARETTPKKPVIFLRGGMSSKGRRAVRSHTGRIASSSEKVVEGMARQAGMITASDERQLVDFSEALKQFKALEDGRTAIMSSAGGMGVIASDLIESRNNGLRVADLSKETVGRLEDIVPSLGSPDNPIDLTPALTADNVQGVFGVLESAEEVDAVLLYLSRSPYLDEGSIPELIETIKGMDKTVIPVLLGDENVKEWRDLFLDRGVLNYEDTTRAIEILGILKERGDFLERIEGEDG